MINRTRMGWIDRRRSFRRSAAVLALTAAAAACDDLPTMPANGTDGLEAQMGLVANSTGVQASVEDAITRLVPALMDAKAATPVRSALRTLAKKLDEQDQDGILDATRNAQSMLVTYERRVGPGSPDAADVEAIRLALP
jgi:hypothetical protein